MKNKINKLFILSWMLLVVTTGDLLAQCAMCKASVETNVNEDGIGFAAKLNTGIIYLFVMPYILVILIGYMWYRKSRQHRQELDEAAFRKSRISRL